MAVTVTVEDGTGLANANAYASVSDADTYFDARPRSDAWKASDADQKARFLIQATRILDASFRWRGSPATNTQGLQFPRYDRELSAVLDGSSVPAFLKTALFELALVLTAEDPTAPDDADGLKRIEFDGLNVELDPSRRRRIPRWLEDLVAPYGVSNERAGSVPIRRA
jgi:hypothetical protein